MCLLQSDQAYVGNKKMPYTYLRVMLLAGLFGSGTFSSLKAQCTSCGSSGVPVTVRMEDWQAGLENGLDFNFFGTPAAFVITPEDEYSIHLTLNQNFSLLPDVSYTVSFAMPEYVWGGGVFRMTVPKGFDALIDGSEGCFSSSDFEYWGLGSDTACTQSTGFGNLGWGDWLDGCFGPNAFFGSHTIMLRSRTPVEATKCDTDLNSVHVKFGLGNLPNGDTAGTIDLNQESLTINSYSPASLTYIPRPGVVTVPAILSASSIIRQVNSPQCLADIILMDSNSYEVRFYAPAQVGSQSPVTGLYALNGNPVATYRVENPDTSTTSPNRIDITEMRSGHTIVNEYSYDAATDSWSLNKGGGARTETSTSAPLANGDTMIVREVHGVGGTMSHDEHIYHQFPWGNEEILTVVGQGNEQIGSVLTFNNGFRTSVLHNDGSYEVNIDPNDSDATIRPFMDAPGFTDALNQSSLHSGWYRSGNGSYEEINGQRMRECDRYSGSTPADSWLPQGTIDEQYTYEFTDANHCSITTEGTFNSNYPSPQTLQPAYTKYPDGRQDSWRYETGTFLTGSNDGTFHTDNSGSAVRKTLTHGTTANPEGIAGLSTQHRFTYDERGHLAMEEMLAMPQGESSYVVVSAITHTYNPIGNLTSSVTNGRTSYSATWDGSRKTSETDEQGVVTTYTNFDGLDRALTVTKNGVPVNGIYAAQASIPTTLVIDANGQTLSQSVGATGGQQLVQSSTYNTAGQIVSQSTNGITTHYTYSNGGRTVTEQIGSAGAITITDHYLDGRVKSISGTGVVSKAYVYGVVSVDNTSTGDKAGYQWEAEYLGTSDPASPSPRYTKTVTDWLGRITRVEKPIFGGGTSNTFYYYNAKGQLAVMTQPGMANTLYTYDAMGNQTSSGLDMDGDGSLDGSSTSTDRFTTVDVNYKSIGSNFYRVTTNTVYGDLPAITIRREQITGLPTNTSSIVTTSSPSGTSVSTTVVDATNKVVTITTTLPGVTNSATQTMYNGLLVGETSCAGTATAIFEYDPLGRQSASTNPGTGATTTTTYDSIFGQPVSITNTSADGVMSISTANTYYGVSTANLGQLQSTNINGMTTNYTYDAQNHVVSVSGNTYPLDYTYDSYGALKTLTTAGAAGSANTTWVYDSATGLLQQKKDDSQHGPAYTYWPSGRIKTRTWARGIVTSYFYDQGGSVKDIKYSDNSTPEVIITNNRFGKPATVADAAGIHTLTYTFDGQLAGDAIGGAGPLAGTNVSVGYDEFLRRSSLTASNGNNSLLGQGYKYDPVTGNMTSLTDDASNSLTTPHSAVGYTYQPNSTSLATTTFKHDGMLRLSIVRVPDGLGRLASIENSASGTVVSSHTYSYNNHGQRNRMMREDGSYWNYGYNNSGELIDGHHYRIDGSDVAGQQFHYTFDSIGNRTNTSFNGRNAAYTPNKLNQYVSRQVPGSVDVIGTADLSAMVAVNNSPVDSKDATGYFYKRLNINNSGSAVNEPVDVLAFKGGVGVSGADIVSEKKGSVFVAQSPEQFSYDVDGNLTNDGRWIYTWDGENRLIEMSALNSVPAEAKMHFSFAYDRMGRRVQKQVFGWNAVANTYNISPTTKTRFAYDGWNLVAELDGNHGNAQIRTYMWGIDLSGALQGAGGIGGLLAMNDSLGSGSLQTHYACCDGSGSITALVSADGSAANIYYEYGPFGEDIRSNDPLAVANPFRFSSHYRDDITEIYYAKHRYYQAQTGRWLSVDPIAERGGNNLYAYCGNDVIGHVDPLGLNMFAIMKRTKVKIVGKSFIARVGKNVGTLPNDPFGATLALFGEIVDAQFSENPVNDAMDTHYRLYSERVFAFCCGGGKISCLSASGVKTDHGMEGPIEAPALTSDHIELKSLPNDLGFTFTWTVAGTPNILAEPSFQLIFPRLTRQISHTIAGQITCSGDEPKIDAKISGTSFPSHRLFVNGSQAATLPQGSLSQLWYLPQH